ncbi:hypothetical protein E4M02_02590 [Brevundimonas sp. S30B]|uniref:hypothetical protein n=1 Tax=unclassified Brevundimonas TaxID=2622653 RepID=UPI001071D45C|nr:MULTISPECIES: hypothetical protein [unclassified Brevundimonas]QBX37222.1 hypothetical protein E4M01_05230 [Brevundimonas sp. MF30-B]TFW03984.1 hypothetical protein E4M02_02590 [Brevundimonas sp. S30B]
MEEALRAHLAANTALTDLVADRIQWGVREGAPSLALHLIDAPPDWHLGGPSGLVMARVQADGWAVTFLGSKAIGEAFKQALPSIGAVIGGMKFQGAVVLDEERGQFGDAPNTLFRTRIDVRVSFSPTS